MSRIATRKLEIPQNVNVTLKNGIVTVNGPKGELVSPFLKKVDIKIENGFITTHASNPNSKFSYAMSGTANSLIKGMIIGVTQGYKKELEISGVGYRAALKGTTLHLNLGYSHPVVMEIPKGISVHLRKPTRITISGLDKQVVGQFAAQIRNKRKVEPYKGKGIRYIDEYVIRKEGKKVGK